MYLLLAVVVFSSVFVFVFVFCCFYLVVFAVDLCAVISYYYIICYTLYIICCHSHRSRETVTVSVVLR